jgi:hypothetical protein
MIVYLLPVGRDRFELYSEPPEESGAAPHPGAGRLRQWGHAANLRWHDLVDTARRNRSTGRIARWRDAVVCRLAETIAEQRTLWALGPLSEATLLFPASLRAQDARAALDRALAAARRHHGIWLAVDIVLFVGSAVLAIVPGPNVIAYYLGFRAVGHWLSWRGARAAVNAIAWTLEPDPSLAELAALVNVPSEVRASRVDAIAARLNLHRLSAFFERVAA